MFLESGFQAFISKPIDMIRLDSILRKWVRDKDREREHNTKVEHREIDEHMSRADNSSLPLYGVKISGVDTAAGLARFGNIEETYMNILRSYAASSRLLLCDMEKHLESVNLTDYAISAHGIKGASFSVEAFLAGKCAERLEQFAKAGETERVLAENSTFVKYMKTLLDSIDNAIVIYNSRKK
jgi:HPt (histidine-containing phosphotransfer) domain-containing protein